MDHFFNELEGAQAVSVEGKVSRVVNINDGLVDCYQFRSIVSSSGPLPPWIDSVAHSSYGDENCCPYFIGLGGGTFNEATVCVDL